MSIYQALQQFLKQEDGRQTLCRVEKRPAKSADYVDWPEQLRPELREALIARGIDQLYSHQREACGV